MKERKPRPTRNAEFDRWWAPIVEQGLDGPEEFDWSMYDYEYHSIDYPMLDAFEAGQSNERAHIIAALRDFRSEHLAPGTPAGDALSNLLVEIACRGICGDALEPA